MKRRNKMKHKSRNFKQMLSTQWFSGFTAIQFFNRHKDFSNFWEKNKLWENLVVHTSTTLTHLILFWLSEFFLTKFLFSQKYKQYESCSNKNHPPMFPVYRICLIPSFTSHVAANIYILIVSFFFQSNT